MRKNKTCIFCLMLIVCTVCQAQKLDVKPYFFYHQSILSQNEPVFYDIHVVVSPVVGVNPTFFASSFSKDFTLATGLEYGLAIDYTFRNQLGLELGLGYFSSQSKPFTPLYGFWCTTDWNYHSIGIRPLFTYSVMKGKSIFTGKTGTVIHYASATMEAFLRTDKAAVCTFDNRLNWGYSTVLEYNYKLSEKLSLAMELGFEQYKYTPRRATVKYENYYVREKDEIIYVNNIVHEQSVNQGNAPIKRLKETILFNSIYFGAGIKYNLWKK